MTDNLTPKQRKKTMTRVKSRDTSPEMRVRRLAHRLGYRFRLHRKDLPGQPDLVFPKHNKVIFVHGCFWHGHQGCPASDRPASNRDYWDRKLDRNIQRDAANLQKLKDLGWTPLVIWECQTRDPAALAERLTSFLSGP
jgi:DNA mismatch endonuclease (patch repair protein)